MQQGGRGGAFDGPSERQQNKNKKSASGLYNFFSPVATPGGGGSGALKDVNEKDGRVSTGGKG